MYTIIIYDNGQPVILYANEDKKLSLEFFLKKLMVNPSTKIFHNDVDITVDVILGFMECLKDEF